MAPRPRFAPTGARTQPRFTPIQASPAPGTVIAGSGRPRFNPSAPNGLQSVSSRGAFTPSQQVGLEQAFDTFGSGSMIDLLKSGKLTPQQKQVATEIASRYQRPSTTLGVIARILTIPANISVGLATAAKDTLSRAVSLEDGFSPRDVVELMPAFWLPQIVGKSFKEIPTAVWENKTYSDLLQESNDPNSFLYRHAMPIGLAMDIAFDPTTYLTVGATAASKVAARGMLHAAYDSSFQEAMQAISSGVFKHPSGLVEKISPSEDVWHLASRIHLVQGRPFTPGDAMDLLNKTDAARLSDARMVRTARKEAAAEGVEVAGKVGMRKAAFRSLAPRGGFGIRMAGRQLVPAKYTDQLASTARRAVGMEPSTFTSARSVAPDVPFKTLADLQQIPLEKIGKLSEDVLRTMLKETTKQIPRDAAFLTIKQVEEARDRFKIPKTVGTATDVGVIARATKVIRNIFVEDIPYVPYEARRGLLRADYKAGGLNPYSKRLAEARRVSLATKDSYIRQAKDMGWPDNQIRDIEKMWDKLVEKYDDPIDVMSRFQIHVGARIYTQDQIDRIFNNPMFAAVISEHTDDLAKALDEVNEVTEKWQELSNKLKAARRAKKPKSTITRYQNRLKELTEAKQAANREYERIAQLQKAELGGTRVLENTSAFTRRIGQDAVVETWRGKKYAVPQMVSDALQEMRNPHVLDRKLEKALTIMNWTQNKWKILATSVNASFHVMNLVGGMWNNMLGGTNSLADHVSAYASVVNARAEQAGKQSWAGKVIGRFGPRGEHAAELQEFVQRSGAAGGMIHADIYGGKELRSQLTSEATAGKLLGAKGRKALTAGRRLYGAAALATAALPDEWVPDDVQDALNPVVGGALLLPEAMKLGRHVASDVEDTLRTAPLIAAERDQSLRQLMAGLSVSPPTNWGKYAGQEMLDLNRVQREQVWAIGARNALHYQFDYSDLQPYERYIAKTIFPFWVFYKNNFILQAREVVNKPRYVATFTDISNYMNTLTEEDDNPYFREMLPEYFDKLNMFRVPVPNFVRDQLGLAHDQDVYLNPKLPFASLNLFPPLWEIFNDNSVTPQSDKIAGMLAPVFGAVGPMAGGGPIKPLLEYTVGYNLGLARPIDYQRVQSGNYRQSSTEAPGYITMLPGPLRDLFGVYKDPETGAFKMHASIKYITDQLASPFINSLGDATATFSGEGVATDRQRANTVAWMTGIRLTPVDPIKLQRSWLYRMENFLEAQKIEAKYRGQEFPRDDERLLRQIRAQLKSVERAWDAQQKDLYGG